MGGRWLCLLLGLVCGSMAVRGQVVQIISDGGGSPEWVRLPHQPKNEKKVDEPQLECLYEYTAIDTVLNQTKLAQVILQVGQSWTKFIDYYNYWIDSVCWRSDWKISTAEILELDQPMPREFYESQLRNIAEERFTCNGQVGLDFYVYEDSTARMDWALAEGEETVCGYACRKATTRFRGRDWTVWYTDEIPVDAGPWKLHGLPGLILKAETPDSLLRFEAVQLRVPKGETYYIAYTYPERMDLHPTREEVLKMERVLGTGLREYMASKGVKVVSQGLPNERTQFPARFFYQPLELE